MVFSPVMICVQVSMHASMPAMDVLTCVASVTVTTGGGPTHITHPIPWSRPSAQVLRRLELIGRHTEAYGRDERFSVFPQRG